MDENQRQLRTFLINIGDRLSKEDCQRFTFLLEEDVPRRVLDNVYQNNQISLNEVWEALINRGKITPDNVNYLIERFEIIRRLDIVRLLKNKYSTSSSEKPSDLFVQHNP